MHISRLSHLSVLELSLPPSPPPPPLLIVAGGRPDTPDYQAYLPWFLEALPSEACAKGGAGAYADALAREGGPLRTTRTPQHVSRIASKSSGTTATEAGQQLISRGVGGGAGGGHDGRLAGAETDTVAHQRMGPWGVGEVAEGGADGSCGAVAGLSEGLISASSFRTYYTPLNEQHVSRGARVFVLGVGGVGYAARHCAPPLCTTCIHAYSARVSAVLLCVGGLK